VIADVEPVPEGVVDEVDVVTPTRVWHDKMQSTAWLASWAALARSVPGWP
jgi:hypothetical protein